MLYRFGVGVTPSPAVEKTALMAGIFSIAWAISAVLWRHVLPKLVADSAIDLFVGDASVTELLLYVRLMVLLAVAGAILFPLAFFFIKKFFNEYEMANQVNLLQPKKNPALNTLFQGAVMNMIFNLIIFGPLLAILAGEEWVGFEDENSGAIMALTFLIKMIAIPMIMIIGSIGLMRTSQALIKPFREGGYQTFEQFSSGDTPASAQSTTAPGTNATPQSASTSLPTTAVQYSTGDQTAAKTRPMAETPPETPNCASCGKPTKYIKEYKRHYCYPCKQYV